MMKSYFKEIKSINQSNALKQAQSLLLNSTHAIDSNSFNSPSSAKAYESQRVKTDPYDSSLEEQPPNTWRGMSFNVPSKLIKVPEFVGFSRTKKNDGQVILTQRSDNTRASTASSVSARMSSPRFISFLTPILAADNEAHLNNNIAKLSQRTNYQPSIPSSTKSQHSNYSIQSVNFGANKDKYLKRNIQRQVSMKHKDTASEQIAVESSKESYFPITRCLQQKEKGNKSIIKEATFRSKSALNTPDQVNSPKAQQLQSNIEMHSFMKSQMLHQCCLNVSQEDKPSEKKQTADQMNATQMERSQFNKSSQHDELKDSTKHEKKVSYDQSEYFSNNKSAQQELISSQQSHRMYCNRMYKIQKAAVSAYLKGASVEKKVIDCHREIVDPLASYIQQKKRDQHMQQLKLLADGPSKNSPLVSPGNPTIMSHEQLVKAQLASSSMPKGCLKVNRYTNNSPSSQLHAHSTVNSSSQQIQSSQQQQQLSSKMQNKISEIMATQTHEQAKQSGTPASFWQSFLKGEKDYFLKLGQLQQIGFENFEKSIESMHKFHYDYLSNPEAQFLSCNDLNTSKSVQVLQQFQRQLKNHLQEEEAAMQLTNKRNNEFLRRKNKRSQSTYNRTADNNNNNNNRSILSRQSSKLSQRCNSTEIEPKQQQQQSQLESPQRTFAHSLFRQAHNNSNLHRSDSSNACDISSQQQTPRRQGYLPDSCKEQLEKDIPLSDRIQCISFSREHSNDNSILKDRAKQPLSLQKTASSRKIAFNLQQELAQQGEKELQDIHAASDANSNALACSLQCPSPKKYQSKNRHKFEKMLHQFESRETMKNRIVQGERAMQQDFDESIEHMERAVQEMEDNYQVLATIQPLSQAERECFTFAKNNNFTELQAYIKVNRQIVSLRDETGKTLLHWAALRGNLEVVDLLCKSKAHLNAVDSAQKKPKDLALQQGCSSTYSFLVKEERFLQRTGSRRLLSQPSGIISNPNSNH